MKTLKNGKSNEKFQNLKNWIKFEIGMNWIELNENLKLEWKSIPANGIESNLQKGMAEGKPELKLRRKQKVRFMRLCNDCKLKLINIEKTWSEAREASEQHMLTSRPVATGAGKPETSSNRFENPKWKTLLFISVCRVGKKLKRFFFKVTTINIIECKTRCHKTFSKSRVPTSES